MLMARNRWHRFGYACVNFGSPVSLAAYAMIFVQRRRRDPLRRRRDPNYASLGASGAISLSRHPEDGEEEA